MEDTVEMKPWQKGIPIERLKKIRVDFASYNEHSDSPFSEMNNRSIADSMDSGNLVDIDGKGTWAEIGVAKSKSAIKMYRDVVLGFKFPKDKIIKKIAWGDGAGFDSAKRWLTSQEGNTWLLIWEEDSESVRLADEAGFRKVGVKISTFAELLGIYFRDEKDAKYTRNFPTVPWYERCVIEPLRLDSFKDICLEACEKIDALDFTNHYSNYNSGKAWGAMSLRGYAEDPAFITKPIEMNNKWKEENKDRHFELQNTQLREDLAVLEPIIAAVPGEKHRIRLMRLTPGGGTLGRHTDQVDPDAGMAEGKLMRVHIPIQTNPGVVFTMWDTEGKKRMIHMDQGQAWHIETRKPHMAQNFGNQDRIHLVMDVHSTMKLRNLVNRDYDEFSYDYKRATDA